MKKYTRDEIIEILNSTPKDDIYYSDEVKERAKNNPYLTRRIEQLCENGDEIRDLPTVSIPFSMFKRYEIDGDRSQYEYDKHGYFIRRNKLQTFGILSWLYGREEDISALEDVIWAILDEYTWALPAHLGGKGLSVLQNDGYTVDLFAAETGDALAEIINIVGDKLHPIVVARAKRLIRERILDRALVPFWWKKITNNWSAVCAGSIGMTAIYECETNEELADIILMAFDAIEYFLSGFSDDGVCLEGLGYWSYGFGYFMCFAELLKRRTRGKIDLFRDDKVKLISTFPQKCFFKGGRTVSFSDSGTRRGFSYWIYSLLATTYEDSIRPNNKLIGRGYSKSGCFRFALEFRNYVLGIEDLGVDDEPRYGTHIFPHAQWYVSSSENNVGIAAKGGHNDEPHNHNDIGSFEVYKNGEAMILDIGNGEYNKDYFSSKRYTIFCNSSRSHNLPIIDGQYQHAGKDAQAKDTVITEEGLSTEISSAYDVEGLEAVRRDIRFDRQTGVITLTDNFEFTEGGAKSVTERFISATNPEICEDKVVIRVGEEEISIYYDSSVSPEVSTETDKLGKNRDRLNYLIDFKVNQPTDNFTVKFTIK